MSCPSKRIAPEVGLSCSRISLEVVVLPQPDSPITPSVSPAATQKSIPSTALTHPTFRRGKSAVVTEKYFVRPSISNSGGDMGVPWGLDCLRFGAPAPCRPGAANVDLARLLVDAARKCFGAPRVKGAARRQRGKIGRLARDREQLLLVAELWHRAEQRLGVGVLRRVEQVTHAARFDNLAGVHDRELVAHARDDAEVMGHKDDRNPSLLLQFLQQVEVLRLD